MRFPLVRADGEELPFATELRPGVLRSRRDGVRRPDGTVPEVARVLRPGGRFVFNMATPFIWVAWPRSTGRPGASCCASYFDVAPDRWTRPSLATEFQLPYGEWIRLFRANGLAIEDLIELRPPADAKSTYEGYATVDWAREFPAEHIWKVRKESS